MAYITSGTYSTSEYGKEESWGTNTFDVQSTSGIYATGTITSVAPYYGVFVDITTVDDFYTVDGKPISWSYKQVINKPDRTDSGTSDDGHVSIDVMGVGAWFHTLGVKRVVNPRNQDWIEINGTCTVPVFMKDDTEAIQRYIDTGDSSGALNSRQLNGTKCDIYITNNGDRIEFNTVVQNENATELSYTHIVVSRQDGTQFNIPTVGKYTTSWEGQENNPLQAILTLDINIYDGGEVVATFTNISLKKKIFGLLGNVSVTPSEGESNGYHYYSSTNNSFDEIGESSQNESNATGGSGDGSGFGGFSNLCATYQISAQALADLGSFIWNNSIFDDIKNMNNSPLENIISLMYMPVDIGGTENNIVLGNITTNVSGARCDQNMKRVNVASFTIPYYNSGFLNFEPYTSVDLYLPFVGMVALQPKDTMGYKITVEYAFDVVVGSFGVFVFTSKGGGKTLIYSSQGTCSVTIPLTASNQAQVQTSILTSGVGLVTDAISGNAMGVLSDVTNIATLQNHSSTFGSPSSMIGALCPAYCYYIVRTPIIRLPDNFAHTKGYICMETYTLSSLRGFTKLTTDVDLSGFNLTHNELERLRSILTSGFYL